MISLKKQEALIIQGLNLVDNFAKARANKYGVSCWSDDFIGAAHLALVEAARSYRIGAIDFHKFMWKRIKGQIVDEFCFLKSIRRKSNNKVFRRMAARNTADEETAMDMFCYYDGGIGKVEMGIDLLKVLESTKLTRMETVFIDLCLIKSVSLVEARKQLDLTRARMSQIKKAVVDKLAKKLSG